MLSRQALMQERNRLAVWHVSGLVFGLGFGFLAGSGSGGWRRLTLGPFVHVLVSGLVVGLVFGLGFSPAWRASVAAAQLHVRWHTPALLMRFLEDARERNVLRTVGSVYQFRHVRLQDRLAAIKAEADKAAGRYWD